MNYFNATIYQYATKATTRHFYSLSLSLMYFFVLWLLANTVKFVMCAPQPTDNLYD
jgi:hypothetical protein